MALRVPDYAKLDEIKLTLNGKSLHGQANAAGFIELARAWQAGDVLSVKLPLTPRFMTAYPRIEADFDKVCLMSGPLVYCAEECDNGAPLHAIKLKTHSPAALQFEPALLEGVNTISCQGLRLRPGRAFADGLYQRADAAGLFELDPVTCLLVPYYAWCNRVEGAMQVWFSRFD